MRGGPLAVGGIWADNDGDLRTGKGAGDPRMATPHHPSANDAELNHQALQPVC